MNQPPNEFVPVANTLLNWLQGQKQAMIDAARELAGHESPSADRAALNELAKTVSARFQGAGANVESLESETAAPNLRLHFGDSEAENAKPVLVLGHYDTVWPIGTLQTMPIKLEGNRLFGPGLYDMKAGLVIFEFAIRAIQSLGLTLPRPIIGLITCDEEIGSPSSRTLIEQEARSVCCALVLEAPLADGRLKTTRKGVGAYVLEIQGRAAHAGVEPEKGVNAFVELAHQILAIHNLAKPELGTTLNIGLIEGGIASNIIPPHAIARIDVRVSNAEEASRIDSALHNLKPMLPEARLRVSGGLNRPPMVRSERTAQLFERAQQLGRLLGLSLGEGGTGGGSDGNFTAALGVPTLDGLGCAGAGAHAAHEQILVDSLPVHAALLALLLLDPDPDHLS